MLGMHLGFRDLHRSQVAPNYQSYANWVKKSMEDAQLAKIYT